MSYFTFSGFSKRFADLRQSLLANAFIYLQIPIFDLFNWPTPLLVTFFFFFLKALHDAPILPLTEARAKPRLGVRVKL